MGSGRPAVEGAEVTPARSLQREGRCNGMGVRSDSLGDALACAALVAAALAGYLLMALWAASMPLPR